MTAMNYWQRRLSEGLSRRRLLRGAAILGGATAAAGLIGCGSGSSSSGDKTSGSDLLYKPVDSQSRAVKGGIVSVSQTNDISSFDA
jgi:hypothetical protein